jgi:hypothetical protein
VTATPAPQDIIDLPPDEPPRAGVFADWDGVQLRPDVVEDGNRLGAAIDVDDDLDNGLDYRSAL